MSQLPGFRKVNTLSALEVDQTFDQAMQLLNIRGTKDQYQFSEEANILFGERYQVSKTEQEHILNLNAIEEQVTFLDQTYEKYYTDQYGTNYIEFGERTMLSIGDIHNGVPESTKVIPNWRKENTILNIDGTPVSLVGMYVSFQDTISMDTILCPKTMELIHLENYKGIIDIRNCEFQSYNQNYLSFVNCKNGKLIIDSNQAIDQDIIDRITNGRLDDEEGIQVEVKP